MEVFIKGIGNISPQNTLNNSLFLEDIVEHQENQLRCVEPDYKAYISSGLSRRMSRIIKMGVASSSICLQDTDVEIPDAIITGTGLGCLQDTEKFLSSIITNQEQLLSPTPFIQSTHNVISSQIALLLKCNNYNHTYVHRGFSFESALLDSMMLLEEKNATNVLLGGIDEITENYLAITKRLECWKNQNISNLELLHHQTPGSLAGEGSAFFLLTNNNDKGCYAKIPSIKTFYKPSNGNDVKSNISSFLQQQEIELEDIDLIILGMNGDNRYDEIYYDLAKTTFNKNNIGYFKHLCGEYHTASSFGLWLGANIIKHQLVPDVIKFQEIAASEIKNILIYNHYKNINHSLFFLSAC